MISPGGAAILGFDLLVAAFLVLGPLRRRGDRSDRGAGNVVVLPRPGSPSLWRVSAFVLVCMVCSTAIIGLRGLDPGRTYRNLVGSLADHVVANPALIASYADRLRPIIPVAVISFVVAQALVFPAPTARRLAILLHAPLALAVAVLADAALTVFAVGTGLPLGPFPLLSLLLHFGIAYLLAMRLAITSYQLPRPTQVPVSRTHNFADNSLVVLTFVATLAGVGAGALWVLNLAPTSPVVFAFVLIGIPAYLKLGLLGTLAVLRLFDDPLPQPSQRRPPIDVIAPAYNEAANIVAWVEAIDRAASVYGGQVRVLLSDDGSTDDTRQLAAAAMSRCTSALGRIITGSHAGKSTALNKALAQCTADIVIRHDTDCLLHPNAFLYTVPWLLHRPDIGFVGAFMLPKMPFRTWLDRMRAMELCTGFGLSRLAYSLVDSQPCVPGNYTAFRRAPAVALGGYAEGMFGEDIDFTCNMARLGYRATYDRRIWAYEDVPVSLRGLREQRRRWNRGSVQNFARFLPLAAGSAGPRFWYNELFHASRRLVMPIELAAVVFAVQAAIFDPSFRLNLGHIVAFYVIAKAPLVLLMVVSVCFRRLARVLPWLPLFLFFIAVKRLANVEALLTFPARPVALPWRRDRYPAPTMDGLRWPVLYPQFLGPDPP